MSQAERYRVEKGSGSAHCCFEATVVDTATPIRDFRGEAIEGDFAIVCECFDLEDAEKVAAALNLTDP